MALALAVHPFGEGASAALERAVREGQRGDPLAPVTVVVDRGAVGLAARRRLASSPGGIANVRFLTWPRLAAELAASWLASTDRPARTPAMELEAVRAVLADRRHGPLVSAADQPSMLRAVARTCRELAAVPDAALEVLARQSAMSAEVVAVASAVRARLAHAFDTAELLAAATAAVRSGHVVTGRVVVHLPERMGPGECELLEAVAAATAADVVVLAGSTGDPAADGPVRALAARLRVAPPAMASPAGAAGRTWVRSAPSADAEVLMALRYLMRRNAEGVPLERTALLYGGTPPYPVLVRDLAAAAGLPTHGPGARTLAASVAGRVLLGALALDDRDWRRDEVAAWMASGPLLHKDRTVPAAEWDRLSCEAGIVGGLTQWRERLAAHAAALRTRAALLEQDPAEEEGRGLATSCRLDAERCEELGQFLEDLARRLGVAPHRWGDWGRWAVQLLGDLLGGPARRGRWPLSEIAAFDAVVAALGALGALDWIGGPGPRPGELRSALAAELDRPAPETTRFGRGVLVGPLAAAVGLDLDVVCVVGMVDGAFLAGAGDDVLVPDRERSAAGGAVPLRAATHLEARRAYLAATAGAAERVLSYPRGDQRTGRELRPARPLLDAAGALVLRLGGDRLHAGDVRWGPPSGAPPSAFDFVRSFVDAVRDEDRTGEPISVADWELRSVARWRAAHRNLSGHFLARTDPVLAAALDARRARRSRRLTRFDGVVEPGHVASPAGRRPQSPTGVEAYARCPRSYLLSSLLGLDERPSPEEVLQLTPPERGVVVHGILEQLVTGEQRGDGRAAEPVEVTEARMLDLAAAAFADLERRGGAGHPALWPIDRARILGDLRQFVRDDAAYRAAAGARPVAVEDRFGFGDDPGVELSLGVGRTVRFRGRMDRVDAGPGGALAVIDYKTGRPTAPDPDDPLAGGTRLQLPVYALAAKQRYNPSGPVTAGYWFVGAQPGPNGLVLDNELVDRLTETVTAAVGGIEGGLFPANPGRLDPSVDARQGHCTTCPFDRLCPADRVVTWARKRDDPALEAYRQMAEPR